MLGLVNASGFLSVMCNFDIGLTGAGKLLGPLFDDLGLHVWSEGSHDTK